MSEEVLYIVYPGEQRKRKAKKFICDLCGKVFLRDIRHTTKSGKYYCSKDCFHKSQGSTTVKCVICGSSVIKLKSRIQHNKSKVFCCSIECSNEARRRGLIKCGPDNKPDLMRNNSNKSRHVYHYKCEVCGNPIGKTKYDMCISCYRKSTKFRENIIKSVKIMKAGGKYHGWQSRNTLSYPEKFFKKVLENNNIKFEGPNYVVKKRDIGIDEPSCYFLDFKIGMVDLEIDGSQHWQYDDRVESDKLRDQRLTKAGYTVYRIRWKSINTESGKQYIKEEIEKLLKFLRE